MAPKPGRPPGDAAGGRALTARSERRPPNRVRESRAPPARLSSSGRTEALQREPGCSCRSSLSRSPPAGSDRNSSIATIAGSSLYFLQRSGGGGNRTPVRGRTGQSVYKRSLRFDLTRTAGSQATYRRASHPSVSPLRRLAFLWGQPVSDAATLATGRTRSDASPNYLGGECEIVIRTYVVSRLINEADRGPRLAAQPENRPRRNLVAPVCVFAVIVGDRRTRTSVRSPRSGG